MSVKDFIYCESVLSKESCDKFIKFFEDNIKLAGPGMMGVDTPIGSLEIHLKLIKKYPNLLLILIPRHVERINDLRRDLIKYNLKYPSYKEGLDYIFNNFI